MRNKTNGRIRQDWEHDVTVRETIILIHEKRRNNLESEPANSLDWPLSFLDIRSIWRRNGAMLQFVILRSSHIRREFLAVCRRDILEFLVICPSTGIIQIRRRHQSRGCYLLMNFLVISSSKYRRMVWRREYIYSVHLIRPVAQLRRIRHTTFLTWQCANEIFFEKTR